MDEYESLSHARWERITPGVAMDIYAQAVTDRKRLAQNRVANLILANQETQQERISA